MFPNGSAKRALADPETRCRVDEGEARAERTVYSCDFTSAFAACISSRSLQADSTKSSGLSSNPGSGTFVTTW